jgi:hypothetical protein
MVASKRSVCLAGEVSTTSPLATRRRIAVTCSPMQPWQWWFLPWTSAATIPPNVTNWVPGVTGTNQPRGSSVRRMTSSDSPASARRRPVVGSKCKKRSANVVLAAGLSPGAGRLASP